MNFLNDLVGSFSFIEPLLVKLSNRTSPTGRRAVPPPISVTVSACDVAITRPSRSADVVSKDS